MRRATAPTHVPAAAAHGAVPRSPFVVKPLGRKPELVAGDGKQWRADKMANRVGFTRQLYGIEVLAMGVGGGTGGPEPAAAAGGPGAAFGTAPGGVPAWMAALGGQPVPAAPQGGGGSGSSYRSHPAGEITRAITLSLQERGASVVAACLAPAKDAVYGRPLPEANPRVDPTLNPSQHRALAAASSRRLTLVQGPPGTGKTALSCSILAYWARSGVHGRGKPPLVCSDSNIAVDNIVMGLAKKGIRPLRLGRWAGVCPAPAPAC